MRPHLRFILPVRFREEFEFYAQLDRYDDWRAFALGDYAWVLQGYLAFRDAGWDVSLSSRVNLAAINVAHSRTLGSLYKPVSAFIVEVRADYPVPSWNSNLRIVQNQDAEDISEDTYYMPHWPQSNIIPRDTSRGGKIENVVFNGRVISQLYSKEALKQAVEKHGFKYTMLDPARWNDFSEADAIVAIRSFDQNTYSGKPPTKIFNAWHAGVPFIGGFDSAYSQVGNPGRDYLQVQTIKELEEALIRLRDEEGLAARLVEGGRQARVNYTFEKIEARWMEFFEATATPAFEQWKGLSKSVQMKLKMKSALSALWPTAKHLKWSMKEALVRKFGVERKVAVRTD